jgi:hypothetical protein
LRREDGLRAAKQFSKAGAWRMSRGMQWMSLLAGVFLTLFGFVKLYQESDWVMALLGVLIVGFTISIMTKSRQGEK